MNKPVNTCSNNHDTIIHQFEKCPLCEAFEFIGDIQESHIRDLIRHSELLGKINAKENEEFKNTPDKNISEILKYNGIN